MLTHDRHPLDPNRGQNQQQRMRFFMHHLVTHRSQSNRKNELEKQTFSRYIFKRASQ